MHARAHAHAGCARWPHSHRDAGLDLPLWMSILPSSGAYAADEAAAAARALLLRILRYDRTRLAACPSGRPSPITPSGVPPGQAVSVPTGLLTLLC